MLNSVFFFHYQHTNLFCQFRSLFIPSFAFVLLKLVTFSLFLIKFLTDYSCFHITDDDDLYEALAQMLSKKHVTDTEMDLDLDAISHGDFRDVPQGHLTFLKSPYNTSLEVQ